MSPTFPQVPYASATHYCVSRTQNKHLPGCSCTRFTGPREAVSWAPGGRGATLGCGFSHAWCGLGVTAVCSPHSRATGAPRVQAGRCSSRGDPTCLQLVSSLLQPTAALGPPRASLQPVPLVRVAQSKLRPLEKWTKLLARRGIFLQGMVGPSASPADPLSCWLFPPASRRSANLQRLLWVSLQPSPCVPTEVSQGCAVSLGGPVGSDSPSFGSSAADVESSSST